MDFFFMKKFIFVTRFFYPACIGIPRIVSDIAFELANKGYEVYVLTSQQGYESTQKNLLKKETISNVKINRISAISFKRTNLLGKVTNYCIFYYSCILHLITLLKQDDIVIVLSDPPLISTFVTTVIKLRRAKLINWIQDIHPEISERLGIVFTKGWLGKILRYFRNISWQRATSNIVLGQGMSNFVQNQQIHSNKIVVYPNWEDGTLIHPVFHKNCLRSSWNLDNKFVIGYSGNLGRAHDFTTLIKAAHDLIDQRIEDIVFLIIGDGYHKNYLERYVKNNKLHNIIFKPFQPREQLQESLNVPDVHILSVLPEMEGLLVPGKLTSAMAAGRPILFVGDKKGEVANILRSESCGETIAIGDSKSLINVILKLRNDSMLRKQWGVNARHFFDKHFDKSVAMGKLCQFLETI